MLALGIERGAVVRLVAFERGQMMDEYLSVPEFYGALPPGDAMALRANPTLLARLTGGKAPAIRAAANRRIARRAPAAGRSRSRARRGSRHPGRRARLRGGQGLPGAVTVTHE